MMSMNITLFGMHFCIGKGHAAGNYHVLPIQTLATSMKGKWYKDD
jgi:hypothetical protein